MKIAKFYAGINQVMDIYPMMNPDTAGSILTSEIISGDVNCDMVFDSYDVVWINKLILNQFDFIANQHEIADINGDGKVNVFDSMILKRNLA